MTERRPIPGFPGYFADSDGVIWTFVRHIKAPPRRLTPWRNRKGYSFVKLTQDGRLRNRSVHVLMALTFIGPKPHRLQVNHKDGNKQNNRVDNLEYVTAAENIRHYFLKLRMTAGGKRDG